MFLKLIPSQLIRVYVNLSYVKEPNFVSSYSNFNSPIHSSSASIQNLPSIEEYFHFASSIYSNCTLDLQ